MKRIFAVITLIVYVGLECGCGSSTTKTNIPIATVQAALVGSWSGTATGQNVTGSLPIQLNVQNFDDSENFLLTVQFSDCPAGTVYFDAMMQAGTALVNEPGTGDTSFQAVLNPTFEESNSTLSPIGDGLNLFSFGGSFTSTTSLSGGLTLYGLNQAPSSCVPVLAESGASYSYNFTLTKN